MVREPDRPVIFDRLDFRPLGGELCVTSKELAREIGFRDPQRLHRWIGGHADKMASFGVPRSVDVVVATGRGKARWAQTYWLNEAHVFFIMLECRGPVARRARFDAIRQIKRAEEDMGLQPMSFFGAVLSQAHKNPRHD
ncbi:hypothetical protein [Bosea sp. ANAM02]|uniref:hypothetical protein n=1 Tax=Bosea sp. ANAM02 TaxID=2020412 RepID=UPI00140ED521|nr:hypothetical protein [Bosea sp. ANAM02]BCB18651.1 hypothetical protein OCUBac02_15450 [Bosea sp. ANAM02]